MYGVECVEWIVMDTMLDDFSSISRPLCRVMHSYLNFAGDCVSVWNVSGSDIQVLVIQDLYVDTYREEEWVTMRVSGEGRNKEVSVSEG
jgi:hypothetical protein